MATPESKVKKAVVKELEAAGVYYFFAAANGYGRAGIPDIICCVNGIMLAIECKAGDKRPTALQEREMRRIVEAGGYALCVNEDPYSFEVLGTTIAILLRREHENEN